MPPFLKNRSGWLWGTGILLLCGFIVFWSRQRSPQAKLRMIHNGMSEEEVRRVLNTEPSGRCELRTMVADNERDIPGYEYTFEFYSRFGGGITIFVAFDEQSYVKHIMTEETYPSKTAYYLSKGFGF